MMSHKTHTAYPEAQRESDGSLTGRIFSIEGQELHMKTGFKTISGYKKWVKSFESQYKKEAS